MSKSSKSETSTARKVLVGFVIALFVLLIAIIGFIVYQLVRAQKETEKSNVAFEAYYVNAESIDVEAAVDAATEEAPSEPLPIPTFNAEGLYSDNAYMIRLSDGAVIFNKNGEAQIYPASITKIMTAITAIENADINMEATVTQAEIDEVYVQGASMAGFEAGETVKLIDLLYGAMLPSGGDACLAIGDTVAGSQQAFIDMMNQKAAELGMVNTHFSNTTGLHADDHYSSCQDFAILTQYALKNETFRQLFTTSAYTTSATPIHPTGITLYDTMFQHLDTNTLENGAVIEGGKTGFTDEALYTLSSLCSCGGQEYVLVTAHAGAIQFAHIADAKYMYSQLPADPWAVAPAPEAPAEAPAEEAPAEG